MLAFSDPPAYNFMVKVYIEIEDLSSFTDSAAPAYSKIEQTAFKMKKRYFQAHPDYTILRTKNGRPYFAHTDALFFSGSHTKNDCITVMAEKNIAVDIEQCRRKQFQAIAEYAFTEAEQKWLAQSNAIEKDFFLLWTIKEADIKLHGASIFSVKNTLHINPLEETVVPGSSVKGSAQREVPIESAAQCGALIGNGNTTRCNVSVKTTVPQVKDYEHSIVSFYITKTAPEKTVHFVASIIIAGHHKNIELKWHHRTQPHTLITAERFFAYPALKA